MAYYCSRLFPFLLNYVPELATGYNAIETCSYRRLRNPPAQPNSTLLDYTRNLVSTNIRRKFKIEVFQNISELCKTMLRGGRGASFTVQPAAGVLEPFSEETIEVTSFCDMWGDYTDQLICNVRLYLYLPMPPFLGLLALDHCMFWYVKLKTHI